MAVLDVSPLPRASRELSWLVSRCGQEARWYGRWRPLVMAPELSLERTLELEMEVEAVAQVAKSYYGLESEAGEIDPQHARS